MSNLTKKPLFSPKYDHIQTKFRGIFATKYGVFN